MNRLHCAIELLGGVSRFARAIGVTQSVVSNWLSRGTLVPPKHCVSIERLTERKVSRRDLRPDDWHLIWPELVNASPDVAHI